MCLYHSLASSTESLMSASHQAVITGASLPVASLGSFCRWGGLVLIIMSNLNLSWVKLMLGWVVTIGYPGYSTGYVLSIGCALCGVVVGIIQLLLNVANSALN